MAEIVRLQPVKGEGACRFDVVIRTDKGKELRLSLASEQLLDYERFQHAVLDECGTLVHILPQNGSPAAEVRAQWVAAVAKARWPNLPSGSSTTP